MSPTKKRGSGGSTNRLTDGQLLALYHWVDLVGNWRGHLPAEVFPHNQAMQRVCDRLIKRGALVPVDERAPAEQWRYRPSSWAMIQLAPFAAEEAQS